MSNVVKHIHLFQAHNTFYCDSGTVLFWLFQNCVSFLNWLWFELLLLLLLFTLFDTHYTHKHSPRLNRFDIDSIKRVLVFVWHTISHSAQCSSSAGKLIEFYYSNLFQFLIHTQFRWVMFQIKSIHKLGIIYTCFVVFLSRHVIDAIFLV